MKDQVTAFAKSEERVFGVTLPEILFVGLFLGGLATSLTGLDHWSDLQQPRYIIGMAMQAASVVTSFALGRIKQSSTQGEDT